MTPCGAALGALLSLVLGHPGGLDMYGGHVDKETGTYHFHRAPFVAPLARPLPIPKPRRSGVFMVSAKPHPPAATPRAISVDRTFPPLPTAAAVLEELRALKGGNGLLAQALAMEAKPPPPGRPAGSYLRLTPLHPQGPGGQLAAMRCVTGTVCTFADQQRADVALLATSANAQQPAIRFLVNADADGWYLIGLHFALPSCGEAATITVTHGAQTLLAHEASAEGPLVVPALVQLFRGNSYLFDVAITGPPVIFRALTVDRLGA